MLLKHGYMATGVPYKGSLKREKILKFPSQHAGVEPNIIKIEA
jgi:hypothetical protein